MSAGFGKTLSPTSTLGDEFRPSASSQCPRRQSAVLHDDGFIHSVASSAFGPRGDTPSRHSDVRSELCLSQYRRDVFWSRIALLLSRVGTPDRQLQVWGLHDSRGDVVLWTTDGDADSLWIQEHPIWSIRLYLCFIPAVHLRHPTVKKIYTLRHTAVG